MSINLGNQIISSGLICHLDPSKNDTFLLKEVEVLVVAGGGGGGRYGAGGGGGGVVYEPSYKVTPGTPISVTVGDGGAGHPGDAQTGGRASPGGNSIFGTLTAIGGGGGGNYNQSGTVDNQFGGPGGSSGGSGSNGNGGSTISPNAQTRPADPVNGQGHRGGYQSTGYSTGAGGGGGAGGPGNNGRPGGISGQGGIGKAFDVSGSLNYYAGGGGGGALNGYPAETQVSGGLGGGGTGIAPSAPVTYIADGQGNSGGGGGGGADNTIKGVARAGNGGSGVVIVRYPGQRKADGGSTINFINGYTIHIFSSGGTFSPYSTVPSNGAYINGLTDLSGNNNSFISRSFLTNQYAQPGTTGEGFAGNNGVTFSVQGTGTFVRQGYGQSYGNYTIQPTDAVYRYDLDPTGCHYHGNDVPIPAGTYATFTFDYYISPDAKYYPLANFLANFESALSASTASPNSVVGTWQTLSFTAGPTGGTGTLRMLLYPGACGTSKLAQEGYILYRNPRVEYHTTAQQVRPTYVSSDKSIAFDGTFGYLAKGNFQFPEDNFTINVWAKTTATLKGLFSYAATSFGGVDNEVLIYDSNPVSFYCKGSAGSMGFSFNDGNWHYISVTRSVDGTVNTYKDGVYVTTLNLTSGKIAPGGSLVIGGEQDTTGQGDSGGGLDANQQFNGNVGSVELYNRILSSSEILNNYNVQKSRFGL